MSRRRKHLIVGTLHQEVEQPIEGQKIVRAVGSRGSNLVEVEYPDGTTTLCVLPAKFNKKLWIKRGGYLIIEDAEDVDARVTGTIVSVLYDDHVKQLKRIPGLWPEAFNSSTAKDEEIVGDEVAQDEEDRGEEHSKASGDDDGDDDDNDGLPPLEPNTNRRTLHYVVSDSDEEE